MLDLELTWTCLFEKHAHMKMSMRAIISTIPMHAIMEMADGMGGACKKFAVRPLIFSLINLYKLFYRRMYVYMYTKDTPNLFSLSGVSFSVREMAVQMCQILQLEMTWCELFDFY